MEIIGFLVVIGIRAGIRPSFTSYHHKQCRRIRRTPPEETAIVLNTPFSIMRTLKVKPFYKAYYFKESELKEIYNVESDIPILLKLSRENVIFIILESFGR